MRHLVATCFLTAALLAACSSSDESSTATTDEPAGSGGTAGSAGESAGEGGSGGSAAGTAGAAGSSGSGGAGMGGTSAGTGGSNAGSGGTDAGAGGTDAGGSAGEGEGGTAGEASEGGAAGEAGNAGESGAAGAPPTNVVRFVAIGDVGKGNSGQKAIAAAMGKKCAESGCDFGILLGDNIYDNGANSVDDPQFEEKFEKIYGELDMPFYVSLGNHDYGGNGAGFEFNKAMVQVNYTNKSKYWRMPAKHYRFTQGPAEFFALDTNEAMFNQSKDQESSVGAWIALSSSKWRIAFGHHPYRSNGPHGNAGKYEGFGGIPIVSGQGVKDMLDSEICGKVDVYLSGHDHSRQYLTDTCNGTELIVSGAGASTTKLEGKNPYRFQSITIGFLYVEISETSLTSQFIDETGAIEYERTLTK